MLLYDLGVNLRDCRSTTERVEAAGSGTSVTAWRPPLLLTIGGFHIRFDVDGRFGKRGQCFVGVALFVECLL